MGGFEQKKNKGNIRLYKFINYENLKIEEIDNINFYEFKGAISCITQSGNYSFIISCWDGNIYSFYSSIFNFYLYLDEKIENKTFKDFFSLKKKQNEEEIDSDN